VILLTCDIGHTGERTAHSGCKALEEREVAHFDQICLNERESREKKALKERERGERERE
jgi:hypothetical protein